MSIKHRLAFAALSVSILLSCNQGKSSNADNDADLEEISSETVAAGDSISRSEEDMNAMIKKVEIDTRYFYDLEFEYYENGIKFGMTDTIIDGKYIKYGSPRSSAGKDYIYYPYGDDRPIVTISGDTLSDTYYQKGNVACMMVDPKDGRDIIFIDRNMLLDTLNLKPDTTYFGERIERMMLGLHEHSVKVVNDTVIFPAGLIITDTDTGFWLNFKVLKEHGKTRLWVEDISDQIIIGDDDI